MQYKQIMKYSIFINLTVREYHFWNILYGFNINYINNKTKQ